MDCNEDKASGFRISDFGLRITMKTDRTRKERSGVDRGGGFTLIELLVVISVMGIIAAMVLSLGKLAARKKKDSVVTAMTARLTTFIESYHSKMGFYPPDNAGIVNNHDVPGTPQYEADSGVNQLLYELCGATLTGQSAAGVATFQPYFEKNYLITSAETVAAYGRGGVANSNPDEPHDFFNPLPKPAEYTTYPGSVLQGLLVPAPMNGGNTMTNFWHYDSSSANRHNSLSFDLWAEYGAGNDSSGYPLTITNGNWNNP